MKRSLFLLSVVLLCLSLTPARLAAQESLVFEVQAGLDSFYKTNMWGPVRVILANQGPDRAVTLQVQDTSYWADGTRYTYPLTLPGQSRKEIIFDIPLRQGERLVVDLLDEGGEILLSRAANIEQLNPEEFLVGVVAGDASLLNALAGLSAPNNGRVGVAHLAPKDLPASLPAWSALDMLVFNDIDTGQLSQTQRDLLSRWVSLGGRLVIGGGPNAAQTIAGLTELLPFSTVSLETLGHDLPALARYAGRSIPDRGPYVAAIPPQIQGEVVVEEGGQAVILSFRRGLGQIHYIAFDLSLAPLDLLAGQPDFLPQLVDQFSSKTNNLFEKLDSGGMRTSLALIPDQTLPQPRTVTLYLVLYVLVVGPLNYFVLGRLKHREWAWFTLPLIVLLFCGVAYASGFSLRGGRPVLRQITVIQAQAEAPLAEVASFIGIYSPRRTAYTLALENDANVQSITGNNQTLNSEMTVIYGNSTTITNLQADIGGMPAVVARAQIVPPSILSNLTFDPDTQKVEGTIFNDTGQAITHAHLVFQDEGLALGTLPPGETTVNGRLIRRYAYNNFFDTNRNDLTSAEILDLASRDVAMKTVLRIHQHNHWSNLVEGLYLAGWQNGSPVNVNLVDQNSHRREDTLLLVGLPFQEN